MVNEQRTWESIFHYVLTGKNQQYKFYSNFHFFHFK